MSTMRRAASSGRSSKGGRRITTARSRFSPTTAAAALVWIADILPHDLAKPIGAMMQHGMDAMKRKLEADATAPAE